MTTGSSREFPSPPSLLDYERKTNSFSSSAISTLRTPHLHHQPHICSLSSTLTIQAPSQPPTHLCPLSPPPTSALSAPHPPLPSHPPTHLSPLSPPPTFALSAPHPPPPSQPPTHLRPPSPTSARSTWSRARYRTRDGCLRASSASLCTHSAPWGWRAARCRSTVVRRRPSGVTSSWLSPWATRADTTRGEGTHTVTRHPGL